MLTQLRIYKIKENELDSFAQEWQQTIKLLREKLGFSIPHAYKNLETNEFVWFLQYDGREAWEDLDKRYHSSPERKAMNPNPARNILEMKQWFVEDV